MIRTAYVAATILLALAISAATLVPIEYRPHLFASADNERGLAYLALGIAGSLASPRRLWLPLLLGIVFATALEFAQATTNTRHGQPHDAQVKAISFVIGLLIARGALAVCHWIVRRKGV